MRTHNFIKLFLIVIILMFVISAGRIFAVNNTSGLISLGNVYFAENVLPNTNSLAFVFFFLLIGFSLVSFFTWAANKNVIEEDDYLAKNNEFELYRPHRDL